MSNAQTHHTTGRRWVFDKTLNVPTLLTVVTMVAATTAFGVQAFSDQDRRITEAERKAEAAKEDIRRVESIQSAQARSNAEQLQNLRVEIRNDIRDVSNKLDTLLMSGVSFRRQPNKE